MRATRALRGIPVTSLANHKSSSLLLTTIHLSTLPTMAISPRHSAPMARPGRSSSLLLLTWPTPTVTMGWYLDRQLSQGGSVTIVQRHTQAICRHPVMSAINPGHRTPGQDLGRLGHRPLPLHRESVFLAKSVARPSPGLTTESDITRLSTWPLPLFIAAGGARRSSAGRIYAVRF